MIVTFCGHAQLSQNSDVEKWLYTVTGKLIEEGAASFYLGGYGDFISAPDRMFPTMTAPCTHRWKRCPAGLRFPAETGGWSMPPTRWWPVCSTIGAEPPQPCGTPDKRANGLLPMNSHSSTLTSRKNKWQLSSK